MGTQVRKAQRRPIFMEHRTRLFYISLFHLIDTISLLTTYYWFYFTDKETESQRDCLYHWQVAEPGMS